MVKKILEQLALIVSQEIKPLYIEYPCYLKSETDQDEKMWEYIKKLNEKERNYKL
jgi:hypothetical protein